YWQVDGVEGAIFRSRSLWDVALHLPRDTLPDGGVHRHRILGPEGQRLIVLERTVALADAAGAYRVAAATDEAELVAAAAAFTRTLVVSLGVLAIAPPCPSTCPVPACRSRHPSRPSIARWRASTSTATCSSRSIFPSITCSGVSSRTWRRCSAT